MHFEKQFAVKMHEFIFFSQKKNVCAYPTLNFKTRYPKHTYFICIWPYECTFNPKSSTEQNAYHILLN